LASEQIAAFAHHAQQPVAAGKQAIFASERVVTGIEIKGSTFGGNITNGGAISVTTSGAATLGQTNGFARGINFDPNSNNIVSVFGTAGTGNITNTGLITVTSLNAQATGIRTHTPMLSRKAAPKPRTCPSIPPIPIRS
jgi:hypothetical protein